MEKNWNDVDDDDNDGEVGRESEKSVVVGGVCGVGGSKCAKKESVLCSL